MIDYPNGWFEPPEENPETERVFLEMEKSKEELKQIKSELEEFMDITESLQFMDGGVQDTVIESYDRKIQKLEEEIGSNLSWLEKRGVYL